MIKILHLYFDLMSLYGDWANPEVLAMELGGRGIKSTIVKKSVGEDFELDNCDFLYIGSGTERSLLACSLDIMRCRAQILRRIEDGMHVLATGNSHELFGKSVICGDGERYAALGLMDFVTTQGPGRVTGDCLCRTSFLSDKLIGFINRASIGQDGSFRRPFELELGFGSSDGGKTEGIQYKNMLGTYMTGPILARNPPLLKYFADKLDGKKDDLKSCEEKNTFFAFQDDAYTKALSELSARAANS